MSKTFQAAIDGPSGAGKSTIARAVAAKLGFVYIDTGAMYRSVGLYAYRHGADTKNAAEVEKYLDEIDIDIKHIGGVQHIFLCGEDVSDAIRTPQMSMAASDVGTIPAVRQKLVALQRILAEKYSVVMDGRDIGTFVLPDADVKIFLTASAEIRAKRRFDELCAKGENVLLSDVLADIKARDYNDSHRDVSPLKKADDATELDTSLLSLEDSISAVYKIISERLK